MSLELIHFPDFKNSFFGQEFSEPLLEALTTVRDELSCKYISYVEIKSPADNGHAAKQDLMVITTVPNEWAVHYSDRNYYDVDPFFDKKASHFQTDKNNLITQIYNETYADPEVSEFIADLLHYQLGQIYLVVATRSHNGERTYGLFSFDESNTDVESFIRLNSKRLRGAVALLHEAVNASFLPCPVKSNNATLVTLTPREVDCLRWAASGKTDGEIAEILNIARWTVVTYLQNAKIKLGCANRTSAVATAISLGVISMPDASHLKT